MIVTLSGANAFRVQLELNKLIANFVGKYGDMGIERVNGAEVSTARIAEAAGALPFLVERRLVIVDAPGSSKDLGESIDAILGSVQEQTDVIFVEPKFDKRSVLYKTLKKKTDYKEYDQLAEPQMAQWLGEYAKDSGAVLTSSDARYLIQRVGVNQLRLKNELDKLISNSEQITRQLIDLLVEPSPQSSIFDLLDAALAGNTKRAMGLYDDQRKQKVEPQAILALLAWQLHILAVVRSAGPKSADLIASEAKLSPFVVRKAQTLSSRMASSALKRLIADTLALDIRLKRESIDADEALRTLLVGI